MLTGEGEMENFDASRAHEDVEFVVGFDMGDAETIRNKFDRLFTAVNLSLCARFDLQTITRITDKVVYFRDDGKPVYSFKLLGGAATLFVSRPPTADQLAGLLPLYRALSADQSLSRVQSLIQASMNTDDDKLRAFLAAWTALEIFVNKQFAEYDARFFRRIAGETQSAARQQYLNRIRDVMKDKYGLRDRFAAIAFQLAPDTADDDLETFGGVARHRHHLAHGEPVDEPTLPVADARNLAIKYLRLHVSQTQAEVPE